MNNKIFWLRLTCIAVLVTLTLSYIFGDVIHSWWDCFSGFVYGMVIIELVIIVKKRQSKRKPAISLDEIIHLFVFVTLTFCYIVGNIVEYHWNWSSGFAYGLTLKGLRETFR